MVAQKARAGRRERKETAHLTGQSEMVPQKEWDESRSWGRNKKSTPSKSNSSGWDKKPRPVTGPVVGREEQKRG